MPNIAESYALACSSWILKFLEEKKSNWIVFLKKIPVCQNWRLKSTLYANFLEKEKLVILQTISHVHSTYIAMGLSIWFSEEKTTHTRKKIR